MNYPDLTEEQSKRAQEFSRAQVEAMCTYIEAERRLTELEDENVKLRESLRDIADHIKSDDGYGIDRGWVLERIRETGIEVPE